MKIIKIERLKDNSGIRFSQEPEGLTNTVEYSDLLVSYMEGEKISEAHSGFAIGLMQKLMTNNDFLIEVAFKHFGSEEPVEMVKR